MSDDRPVLKGYEVEPLGDGWVARPIGGGLALIGKDQAELNAERHKILSADLSRRSSRPDP